VGILPAMRPLLIVLFACGGAQECPEVPETPAPTQVRASSCEGDAPLWFVTTGARGGSESEHAGIVLRSEEHPWLLELYEEATADGLYEGQDGWAERLNGLCAGTYADRFPEPLRRGATVSVLTASGVSEHRLEGCEVAQFGHYVYLWRPVGVPADTEVALATTPGCEAAEWALVMPEYREPTAEERAVVDDAIGRHATGPVRELHVQRVRVSGSSLGTAPVVEVDFSDEAMACSEPGGVDCALVGVGALRPSHVEWWFAGGSGEAEGMLGDVRTDFAACGVRAFVRDRAGVSPIVECNGVGYQAVFIRRAEVELFGFVGG